LGSIGCPPTPQMREVESKQEDVLWDLDLLGTHTCKEHKRCAIFTCSPGAPCPPGPPPPPPPPPPSLSLTPLSPPPKDGLGEGGLASVQKMNSCTFVVARGKKCMNLKRAPLQRWMSNHQLIVTPDAVDLHSCSCSVRGFDDF